MRNVHGVDISAVGARLDREWLWHELSEHGYWAKYRTRDMFEQQLDSAWRVVGAYRAVDGRMVGSAAPFLTEPARPTWLTCTSLARNVAGGSDKGYCGS